MAGWEDSLIIYILINPLIFIFGSAACWVLLSRSFDPRMESFNKTDDDRAPVLNPCDPIISTLLLLVLLLLLLGGKLVRGFR